MAMLSTVLFMGLLAVISGTGVLIAIAAAIEVLPGRDAEEGGRERHPQHPPRPQQQLSRQA